MKDDLLLRRRKNRQIDPSGNLQSKALILLLLSLAACALWGCGGSDDGTASTAPGTGAATGDRQGAAENLHAASRQVQRERQRLEQKTAIPDQEGKRQGNASPDSPRWLKQHHDSGGGAAQFEVKNGDNSVQEFGAEASAGEREEAAAALHAFLDARAARQWAAACSFMSVASIVALEQIPKLSGNSDVSGCPEVLGALGAEAAQKLLVEGATADVGALRIEGERGFILYHGANGNDLVMPMVREDGSWKVGNVEPVPLGI